MKKTEGEATLLEKTYDPKIDALRFSAEGGLYHIQSILKTTGTTGWVFYAGTLRAYPVNPPELADAIAAREATHSAPPQP